MAKKSIINFSTMVERLEYLKDNPKIQVVHADFTTESITVLTNDEKPKSFDDMLNRIKFIEMAERLVIEKANFETGEITVKVLDYNKTNDLTKEEIDFLKTNKAIFAIKSIRARTLLGLADAIELCKKYILRNRNVFPNGVPGIRLT